VNKLISRLTPATAPHPAPAAPQTIVFTTSPRKREDALRLGADEVIQKVNEAYDRLLKPDVKYHFSIDMASLKSE